MENIQSFFKNDLDSIFNIVEKSDNIQKEKIIRFALIVINESNDSKFSMELKLKAWMLIPNSQKIDLHRYVKIFENFNFMSPKLKDDILDKIYKNEEFLWRLPQLQKMGVISKYSLIEYAVEKEDEALLEDLIRNGNDINQTDFFRKTLLQNACKFGNKKQIEILIKYGADVNFRINGYTPLTCLIKYYYKLYEIDSCDQAELPDTFSKKDCNENKGKQINLVENSGNYKEGFIMREELVVLLVDKGGKINLEYDFDHYIKNNNLEYLEMILKKFDIDVNKKYKNGETILDKIIKRKKINIKFFNHFFEKNVEITLKNKIPFVIQQLKKNENVAYNKMINRLLEIGEISQDTSSIKTKAELLVHLSEEDYKKYRKYGNQPCFHKLTAKEPMKEAIIGHSIEDIVYVLRNTDHAEEFLHFINVRAEILKEIQSIPNTMPDDVWERYVVRKAGFSQSQHMNFNQKTFGNMMHRSVQIAAEMWKKDTFNISEIRKFLAQRRRDIAFLTFCNDPKNNSNRILARLYGLECDIPHSTPLVREYFQVLENTWEYIKKCKKEEKNNLFYEIKQTDINIDKPNGNIQFYSMINGEKVKIYRVNFDSKQFYHTQRYDNPSYSKIIEYLDSLYEKAVKETDQSELLKICAKIFYWNCHAKTYDFGEPSIAETEFRSLWESKEFDDPRSLPPWKKGVIPWVEAVSILDEDEFVKKFPSFFDWEKVPSFLKLALFG